MEDLVSYVQVASPIATLVILFLGTFVLEDAAIVAGAILVSQGDIGISAAFITLLMGIIVGDFLLYYFGRRFGHTGFMSRWQDNKNNREIGIWLRKNAFFTILVTRFTPGLRLPCYLSCGWFSISLGLFLCSVGIAGCLWMILIFLGFLWGGAPLWQHPEIQALLQKTGLEQTGSLWIIAPFIVVILYLMQRGVRFIVKSHLGSQSGNKKKC